MATMHEVDYKIFGDDMQFVEVELDPGEATVAEAGGMMYMDDGIEMETNIRRWVSIRQWNVGCAGRRRKKTADRRIAVHDGLYEQRWG